MYLTTGAMKTLAELNGGAVDATVPATESVCRIVIGEQPEHVSQFVRVLRFETAGAHI